MRPRLTKSFQNFSREENGNGTIEFVIMIPLLFTIFLTSVELGIYSMRQMWLDRGLDIAMREIRLNTGDAPEHDELKTIVCNNAGFLPSCSSNLRLELVAVDPRNFTSLNAQVDCVDQSEPVETRDEPNYITGVEHDLMLVRACLTFNPIFPTTGLGFHFTENGDGAGQFAMSAMSAFVQEPGS